MQMKRPGVLATCGLMASMLSACGGQQVAQSGSPLMPLTKGHGHNVIPPPGSCGGTNQVRVRPCPVRLTRKTINTGVVVTVTGTGITAADLVGYCDVCNAARLGNTWTQFTITSGAYCGTQELEFEARNSTPYAVGYGYLKVKNKYCPGS